MAHVGDSRVYVLRDGTLEQITNDHSWVEEQVRAGTLSPTAARQHPWRNVVTRALSGGEDPEVDVTEVVAQAGRTLPAVLRRSLHGRARQPDRGDSEQEGSARCDLHARSSTAANEAGGPDNITALILQIDAP